MAVDQSAINRIRQATGKITGTICDWTLHTALPSLRQSLVPAIRSCSVIVKNEALKIHNKQSWLARAGTTFASNAAGLGTAMFSTRIVEYFVEKRELSNMWGLFSSRPVVSETTFEILSFLIEFVIALFIFTITEYYFSEYLGNRNGKEQSEAVLEKNN